MGILSEIDMMNRDAEDDAFEVSSDSETVDSFSEEFEPVEPPKPKPQEEEAEEMCIRDSQCGAQLFSQCRDMHANRVAERIDTAVPDMLNQLLLTDRASLMLSLIHI